MSRVAFPFTLFRNASLAGAPTSPQTFTFVSDGDTNGLFYFLGRNYGVAAWTNPNTSGKIIMILSDNVVSGDDGTTLVNRVADSAYASGNATGKWFAVDVGAAGHSSNLLTISDYWMRQRAATSTQAMRNWNLQGSNNVMSNDITGINAATWVNLDVRVNDTTMGQSGGGDPARYVVGGSPAAYRWFRIINTGLNSSAGGTNDANIQVGEWELYGTFSF